MYVPNSRAWIQCTTLIMVHESVWYAERRCMHIKQHKLLQHTIYKNHLEINISLQKIPTIIPTVTPHHPIEKEATTCSIHRATVGSSTRIEPPL